MLVSRQECGRGQARDGGEGANPLAREAWTDDEEKAC